VYLPFQTTAENFEAWQEHWTAGALQHRCDGETCVLWLDGLRYNTSRRPCPHRSMSRDERDRCKPAGRLKVIIPELRRMAYVTVLTGSIHDIIALSEQLTALESLRGDLRGIPLVLRRSPREISMPGTDGKRRRMEKWLLSIEAAPTWVDLQLAAQERAALPVVEQPRPALPAPVAYLDRTTGEIWDADDEGEPADEPAPALDRKQAVAQLRVLVGQARDLGLEPPSLGKPADLSDTELQQAIAGVQTMIAAERAVLAEEPAL
jgi:hypothetical protein